MKSLLKKPRIFIVLALLFLIAVPSTFFGVSKIIKYRELSKEYNIIKNNINKPLEKAVTDAGGIRNIIKGIPNSEVILTAEFSAKDKTVIRSINIDDLDSTEGMESLEFTIRTSDVNSSLKYLAYTGLAFSFIDVSGDTIMFRILIEGVK